MQRRRSLAGSLSGSLAGALGDRSGGGAVAFSGVIDNMIAAGGSAPNYFWCISHRLYSAYTGPLFRASLVDGTSAADFVYDVATNRLDEVALVTQFGASDAYIDTPYDQTGNGRDQTQATLDARPKIYDGATQSVVKIGSLPWATFDGGDSWGRGDSSGLSGSGGVTYAAFANVTSAPAVGTFFDTGNGVNGQSFSLRYSTSMEPRLGHGSSPVRVFTPATPISSPTLLVGRLASGGDITAATMRQDGVDLSVLSTTGSGVHNIAAGTTRTGARLAGVNPHFGGAGFGMLIATELTGAPLAAFEAFGAELKALT